MTLKHQQGAIHNLSEMIEEELNGQASGDIPEYLGIMKERVKKMNGMIDGILEYSRAGTLPLEKETVDINELIEETLDLITPPEEFRIDVAPGMPIFETERIKIQQVFQNLISNAIKYHSRTDGCVKISWKPNGEFYQFMVADDGPGIPPQYHDKVFALFNTGSVLENPESTGVGLSIVKRIIEEHGGSITLESEKDQGATFRFSWPMPQLCSTRI